MSQFTDDIVDVLQKLARLPQVRCAYVDWLFPNGISQQCRIYQEHSAWMMEFTYDRRGPVEQFFDGMDLEIVDQNGFKIIRGTSRFDTIREIGPSAQGWYHKDDWEYVQRELRFGSK